MAASSVAQTPTYSYSQGLEAYTAGDGERALKIWTAMADTGSPLAMYGLGKLYETGTAEVPRDEAEAAAWYRKASSAGVAAAMNNLALQYLQGRGVPSDPIKAVELWQDAAERGHPHAQYNLALAYLRGNGINKDDSKAAAWFLRSADLGIANAQYAAGEVYRLGIGVEPNAGVALAWYRKAGEKGHKDALLQAQSLELAGVTPREVRTGTQLAPGGQVSSLAQAPNQVLDAPVKDQNSKETADGEATGASASTSNQILVGKSSRTISTPRKPLSTQGLAESGSLEVPPAPGTQPPVQTASKGGEEDNSPADPVATAATSPNPSATPTGTSPAKSSEPATTVANDSSGKVKPVEESSALTSQQAKPADAPQQQQATEVAAVPDPSGSAGATSGSKDTPASASAGPANGLWLGSGKSKKEVQGLWDHLRSQAPDLLNHRQLVVEEEAVQGLGKIYRAIATGWSSQDAALEDCFALRRKAPASFCSPVLLE
ncbi:hypothetical protein ACTL6U_03045 [Rhodovibrionaceae bacterium A322]